MKNIILLLIIFIVPFTITGQNNLVPNTADCSGTRPPFEFTIEEAWTSSTANGISTCSTPLAGDLDGDGVPEVIAFGDNANVLYILDGRDGSEITRLSIIGNRTAGTPNIAICRIKDKGAIFNAGDNGNLTLFKVTSAPGERPMVFETEWTTNTVWPSTSSSWGNASMPVVTDFDGDGIVEFIARGQIIDSQDGSVLANLPYTSESSPAFYTSFHIALDLDDDGFPEIVSGTEVYKFSRNSTPQLQLWRSLSDIPGGCIAQNGSSIGADVNQDGNVDLVFFPTVSGSNNIYVWTPETNELVGTINISSIGTYHSYPFVGDIDGEIRDGKTHPEIVFIRARQLLAYRYDESSATNFSLKWTMSNGDNSGATSITLFDFNNDGVVELVYRDEKLLQIFDGSPDGVISPSDALYSKVCGSLTCDEAPIIADVTGDGSADIIVTGRHDGSYNNSGEVMVFQGAASKWASCPSVWNQQLYSPLHVNADLSIPDTIKSVNITFTRQDASTVQFYNGGPMQAPYISETTFLPVDLAPDVYVIDGSITTTSTSATLTVTVGNMGMAVASANIPITYYKDAITPANIIGTGTLGVDLPPGQTTVITKVINDLVPMPTQFQVRLLDDGISFPASGAYSDCDLSNNTKSFGMLEITKVIDNNTACVNSVKVFTITLSNNELFDREDIVIIDSLGDGWEFISATPSDGTIVGTYNPSNHQISWTIPSLPSGSSEQLLLVARAVVDGTLRNMAWVEQVDNIAQDRTERAAYAVVSAGAPPTAPVITYSGTLCSATPQVTLSATGSGSFQWFRNSSPIVGATSSTYVTNVGGNYKVTVSDGMCTSDLSTAVYLSTDDCIEANPDYVIIEMNRSVTVNVLSNDELNSCSSVIPSIISGPLNGTATLSGSMIVYTPTGGFTGIDSLSYKIECFGSESTAKLYIAVLKPSSFQYIACPGAILALEMGSISNVYYYWYDSGTSGSLLSPSSSNSLSITKNNLSVQSVYVEPRFHGMVFPRYRIDILLGDNCGSTDPTGCASTGTLIWKEDFGGNDPVDPVVSPGGIPQVIGYTFTNEGIGFGNYSIRKESSRGNMYWHVMDDHTYPGDITRGYLISFDASNDPGQFYEHTISNLCSGTRLYFSAWISSLCNIEMSNKANQTFVVDDLEGNVLATYYTGDIPDSDPTWKQYGFEFTVPSGNTSVRLRIINNGTGSQGNDFVMDDIEIRLCAPEVEISSPESNVASICEGDDLVLSGSYTDDGTFGNNLVYYWESSLTGDINTPGDWTEILSSGGTSTSGTVSSNYTINDVSLSHSGYYRLVVANSATIGNSKCRASSVVISVTVNESPYFTLKSDTTICNSSLDLRSMISGESPAGIIRYYKDAAGSEQLSSPVVNVVSDTTYYVRSEVDNTGCKTEMRSINVVFENNPVLGPVTGDNRVCKNSNITLTHNTGGGVWNCSNPSIAEIINSSSGSVTLKGISEGYCYVSYTVGNNCQTTVTIRIKVLPEEEPEIIIGF